LLLFKGVAFAAFSDQALAVIFEMKKIIIVLLFSTFFMNVLGQIGPDVSAP